MADPDGFTGFDARPRHALVLVPDAVFAPQIFDQKFLKERGKKGVARTHRRVIQTNVVLFFTSHPIERQNQRELPEKRFPIGEQQPAGWSRAEEIGQA